MLFKVHFVLSSLSPISSLLSSLLFLNALSCSRQHDIIAPAPWAPVGAKNNTPFIQDMRTVITTKSVSNATVVD